MGTHAHQYSLNRAVVDSSHWSTTTEKRQVLHKWKFCNHTNVTWKLTQDRDWDFEQSFVFFIIIIGKERNPQKITEILLQYVCTLCLCSAVNEYPREPPCYIMFCFLDLFIPLIIRTFVVFLWLKLVYRLTCGVPPQITKQRTDWFKFLQLEFHKFSPQNKSMIGCALTVFSYNWNTNS